MGLKDTVKNRKELRLITQDEWDELTAGEQYNRIKLKEDTGDNTLLENIVYDKKAIIFRKNNPGKSYVTKKPPCKEANKIKNKENIKTKSSIKTQEHIEMDEDPYEEKSSNLLGNIQNTLKEFTCEIKSKNKEIVDLKTRIKNIEKTLKEHTSDLDKSQSRITGLEDKITGLEEENKLLTQEIEKLTNFIKSKFTVFETGTLDINNKLDFMRKEIQDSMKELFNSK